MNKEQNLKKPQNQQLNIAGVMPSTLFRYFVRKNYPTVEISNEDLDEVCTGFNEYLKDLETNKKKYVVHWKAERIKIEEELKKPKTGDSNSGKSN